MKYAVAALSLALTGFAFAASASEVRPFAKADFEAAQATGAPILVDISADWCPTCRAQKPTVQSLAAEGAKGLVVFEVDFDDQKDVVRGFGAQMQSTLIVFKGTTETGRSVGETDPEKIKALVASAH